MAEKQYRTACGIVQFEPREGEAAGKQVRNIVIRQAGFGQNNVKVYATVWPDFEEQPLAQGDIVFVEGSYTQGKGKDPDNPVVYHNLSVTRLAVLGSASAGKKVEVTETVEEVDEDEVPF
jgi:hypothetical protein